MIPQVKFGTDSTFQIPVFGGAHRVEDLSELTRVTLEIAGVEIDSDVVGPGVIRWDTVDDRGADVIRCALGGQQIPPGVHGARVLVYSAAHPQGRVITASYPLEFFGDPGEDVPPPASIIVLYDTFTALDGTLLTNHTSDSGHSWADGPSTFGLQRCKIVDNHCVSGAAGSGGGANVLVGETLEDQVRVTARATYQLGGFPEAAMRFYLRLNPGAPGEFIAVSLALVSAEIGAHVIVAGTRVGFIPWVFSGGGTWTLLFVLEGSTLTFSVDGIEQGSVTDAQLALYQGQSFCLQKQALFSLDPWKLDSLLVEKDFA